MKLASTRPAAMPALTLVAAAMLAFMDAIGAAAWAQQAPPPRPAGEFLSAAPAFLCIERESLAALRRLEINTGSARDLSVIENAIWDAAITTCGAEIRESTQAIDRYFSEPAQREAMFLGLISGARVLLNKRVKESNFFRGPLQ